MVKLLSSIIFFSYFSTLLQQSSHIDDQYYFHSLELNKNTVYANLNNIGSMDNEFPGPRGARWLIPYFLPASTWDNKAIVYDQGIWIIGKMDGKLNWLFNRWISIYTPGPIINGKAAYEIYPEDSLRYRMYKISLGDDASNPDYAGWPADFGAPLNNKGQPLVFGEQTVWTVYNGFDTNCLRRNWCNRNYGDQLSPMPVEIQQMAYSYRYEQLDLHGIYSSVIFLEWTLINKGNVSIDSTFVGFWTDIDFFDMSRNFPGVDTTCQVGYCWSGVDSYEDMGTPPAVGYCLIHGPIVPSINNSAVFKGKIRSGYRNLPMTSFHGFPDDGAQEPFIKDVTKSTEAYHIAQGFDSEGNNIIDPVTGNPTKFPFNGDPVTSTGWVYDLEWAGGGAGFVFFSGPFDFAPGDTQWVMIALVPGLGVNRFDSINKMREKCAAILALPYDSLAFRKSSITSVRNEPAHHKKKFKLFQNHPNPFNSITTIDYQLPATSHVELTIYSITGQKIVTLISKQQPAGYHEIEWNGSDLASGVYFYQLSAVAANEKENGFVETQKLVLLK